jgi:hypothetical protein
MTGSMNDPLLEDHLPARIMVEAAAVSPATGYPAVLNRHLQGSVRVLPKLREDLIAVVRVHCRVMIPMEHNGGDGA